VKISVRVKPNSKKAIVELAGDNKYTVRVKEKALEGRANEAVVKCLSDYFDLPKSRIVIKMGLKSRDKVVEII
jgi:hypothetical protein